MSKKYKDKLCVYCGQRRTETADHVFAREFFLPRDRSNLPKVPACKECNSQKADLEHYLTCILPFSGKHGTAEENIKIAFKRLEKNRKLQNHLSSKMKKIWLKDEENGLWLESIALPIDSKKLKKLFEFITKGLLFYHWNVILSNEFQVLVKVLDKKEADTFNNVILISRSNQQIYNDLGNGTFVYEGRQGVDRPEVSVWKFIAFGGGNYASSKRSIEFSPLIRAMTRSRNKLVK